jgi:hypothetical protein
MNGGRLKGNFGTIEDRRFAIYDDEDTARSQTSPQLGNVRIVIKDLENPGLYMIRENMSK